MKRQKLRLSPNNCESPFPRSLQTREHTSPFRPWKCDRSRNATDTDHASICPVREAQSRNANETDHTSICPVHHTTPEKFEKATSFLRWGLLARLIRHENSAFYCCPGIACENSCPSSLPGAKNDGCFRRLVPGLLSEISSTSDLKWFVNRGL